MSAYGAPERLHCPDCTKSYWKGGGLSCNISQTNFRIQTWFVISSAIGELISDFCHRRQNMIQKPGTAGLAGIRKIAMAGKNGTRLAVSMSMRRMRPELFVFARDEGSI